MSEELTMIERVAKAIWEANAPPGAPDFDGLNSSEQYQVELIAVECIRAMREPTEAILKASPATGPDYEIQAKAIWCQMIDAALEEV